MSIQHIIHHCGLTVTRYEPVHGGDINHAYCLYNHSTKYFLKVNDAKRYPFMFDKEVNGLYALHQNSTLSVPRVIKAGNIQQEQYLLLEWMEKGPPDKMCGKILA